MKTVLITGATSGIGQACSDLFLKKGWNVIATGRDKQKLEILKESGASVFQLDVTKQQDINNLVTHIVNNGIRIDVLVNNAGFGQFGTIEETPDDKVRTQFDTNVFGMAAMIRAILPMMRENSSGRIVNISSAAGLSSMPGGGWYAASKFAVEALSDALRWEIKKLGIKVAIIEPGPIKTEFAGTVHNNIVIPENTPYGSLVKNLTQSTNGFKGGTVENCAKIIYKASTRKRPRNRYLVTKEAKLIKILLFILPPKVMDFFVIKMFIPALELNCRRYK
ncbi:MAG: SDR family oxidoreductase [Bacteroidales bacterium]|nr:SDR family oxidoreductase [Bacteroidales bacterium]MDD4218256.1 SDR family oxidoreductase [Bacteroidales bacterium]MDY0143216.1 SDR family oxidoreductase [Bacteroidales bacterium]